MQCHLARFLTSVLVQSRFSHGYIYLFSLIQRLIISNSTVVKHFYDFFLNSVQTTKFWTVLFKSLMYENGKLFTLFAPIENFRRFENMWKFLSSKFYTTYLVLDTTQIIIVCSFQQFKFIYRDIIPCNNSRAAPAAQFRST